MPDRPERLLLIDTAGPAIGIAAWVGDEGVFLETTRRVYGADGWLGPVLAAAVTALGDIDAVGVSVGPGAFTGLRVGVSTALGLGLSRGVPVRPVSSLALRAAKALAWRKQVGAGPPEALALLDAKKSRLYVARFDIRGAVPLPVDEERDVAPDEAAQGTPAWAVGEGAAVASAVLASAGHRVVDDPTESPVKYGLELLRNITDHRLEQVMCAYLRGADAVPRP